MIYTVPVLNGLSLLLISASNGLSNATISLYGLSTAVAGGVYFDVAVLSPVVDVFLPIASKAPPSLKAGCVEITKQLKRALTIDDPAIIYASQNLLHAKARLPRLYICKTVICSQKISNNYMWEINIAKFNIIS